MKLSLLSSYIGLLFFNLHVLVYGAGGAVSGPKAGIGTSSDTENIKFLRENHPLLMECNIKKDLHELKWFKNNEEISPDDEHYKIRQNSTLYIASAKMDDVGVYRCQTVNESPVQSFNVSIIYLAFKKLPKSITVLQGDKLSIACEVEGNPMPTIKWAKENVDVKEAINESRYHLEANDKHTENATFIINEAEYGDRANYVCFITSAGINYNTTTYVRVKDMYAALWPFLGICVEVFILCLIIFIYEKRRAKAEFEESDTDQPIEQKNKSDQNKDVRQRK